jgi:hypothetical protein
VKRILAAIAQVTAITKPIQIALPTAGTNPVSIFAAPFRHLILASFVLFILGLSVHQVPKLAKVFDHDVDTLKPYVWLNSEYQLTPDGYQERLDYGDPNILTMMLFRQYFNEKDVEKLMSGVDKIIRKWELNSPNGHLNYTFSYGKLPAGWRSGMDTWSFPLLLIALWQETNNSQYRDLALKLIKSAQREAPDGGTLWRLGADRCWFSEYAWDGMGLKDEYYVLNGHLLALQSIKMLADATGDTDLKRLYKCGFNAAIHLADKFAIGDTWALYMLNPPTINQTHYLIYETMQFDALYKLDKHDFFKNQAALRRSLLKRHFPIYVNFNERGRKLIFSAVGAPHPYSIDTYPLSIECTGGSIVAKFELRHPTDKNNSISKRAMFIADTKLPADAACKVVATHAGRQLLLFETSPVLLKGIVEPGRVVPHIQSAQFDAVSTEKGVSIIPDRRVSKQGEPLDYLDTQGRITFIPVNKFEIGEFIANGE